MAKTNILILALAISWSGGLGAQDAKKKQKVDQAQIDQAIKRGVNYLKGCGLSGPGVRELILWTFVHAGVPESDSKFQEYFKDMMKAKLEKTYWIALQAMILEELDRVKYQRRIAQCGQFLIDNQAKNGQWAYGDPTPFADDVPTATTEPAKRPDVATGTSNAPTSKPKEYDPSVPRSRREKPKVTRKIILTKKKEGPEWGDNSNSQYAALGLRACHDAGVVIPPDVIKKAMQWWRLSQKDGTEKFDGSPAHGWCYCRKDAEHAPYGSMTAGAVGSLIIYDCMLGQTWMKDPNVLSGLTWLALHFSVTFNPGLDEQGGKKDSPFHYYYYLYALERAGTLYGTEVLAGHEWYPEGTKALLQQQKRDGSWDAAEGSLPFRDTCFAILFLKRATRPLIDVVTEDSSSHK